MIKLQDVIYYEFIDDETVEVFDRYKWVCKRSRGYHICLNPQNPCIAKHSSD